jgi:plasmid stabilization system protein ParE
MRVEFSSFVESDLDSIADYIAQDNPTRAVTFLQEIQAQIHGVGRNPLIYQLRPEIGEGARMAIVGRYAILFRMVGDIVRIERVVYGGRDLLALFQPEE